MFSVLRRHPQFRRLWIAQAISQGGDWLGRLAILKIIGDLQGSLAGVGTLFGVELAIRLVPYALVGPLAGPVADRFPRKAVMVLMDFLRAAVVLGFLLVRDSQQLDLLYLLLIAQMSLSPFFDAARSASIPNTVPAEDLHAAQALSAATWSIMLAVGALAGGALVHKFGPYRVFVFDAATYVLSALVLWRLKLPPVPAHHEPFRWRDILSFRDLRRGLAHAVTKGMTLPLFAKTFWGAAGGYLVILSIAGRDRFGSATTAGLMTGLLFAARGIGTALGPILSRRYWGSEDSQLRRQISIGFLVAAAAYFVFAGTHDLTLGLVLVCIGHAGGSMLWVSSTTLWQKHVDDAYRGRVFMIEFLGMTLAFSVGGLVAGIAHDRSGSLTQTTWLICVLVLVLGAAWTTLARRGLPKKTQKP